MKQKHFTDTAEDLDANRHGYLSLSQQHRLRRKFWEQCRIGWGIFLTCIAGVIYVIFFAAGKRSESADLAMISSLSLIILYAVIITRVQWQRCRDDLDTGGVESVVGNVSLDVHVMGHDGRLTTYGVSLGQFRWTVSREDFLGLSNGDPYRVYYTPRTRMLRSYERVSDIHDMPEIAGPNAGSVFMGTVEESKRLYLSLSDDGELIKVDTEQDNQAS